MVSKGQGSKGNGSKGSCGGSRRGDGSGKGIGNRGTPRQPKR